jgi:hypothetical protein
LCCLVVVLVGLKVLFVVISFGFLRVFLAGFSLFFLFFICWCSFCILPLYLGCLTLFIIFIDYLLKRKNWKFKQNPLCDQAMKFTTNIVQI